MRWLRARIQLLLGNLAKLLLVPARCYAGGADGLAHGQGRAGQERAARGRAAARDGRADAAGGPDAQPAHRAGDLHHRAHAPEGDVGCGWWLQGFRPSSSISDMGKAELLAVLEMYSAPGLHHYLPVLHVERVRPVQLRGLMLYAGMWLCMQAGYDSEASF